MRPDSINAGIAAMLQRFRKVELWLRAAGLPGALARLPCSLLCLHYCYGMRRKTARIDRVASRIRDWLASVVDLAGDAHARMELIDVDRSMHDDVETTKRTLDELRALSLDVMRLFTEVEYTPARLQRTQALFVQALAGAHDSACALQHVLAEHDRRALALLRDGEAAASV